MSSHAKRVNSDTSERKTRAGYEKAMPSTGQSAPRDPHQRWAQYLRQVRSELGLSIFRMAEDIGVSEPWLKKALAGKSINGEFRQTVEKRVSELWKKRFPLKHPLHFPPWEDHAPWSSEAAPLLEVAELTEKLRAVQEDVDAVASIQFHLPQAFRIGWSFDDKPLKPGLFAEAISLGLERFVDGSNNDPRRFAEAAAQLTQSFGPRTSGIFQIGHFSGLLCKVGYGDAVPKTLSVFRQTLSDIRCDERLINAFENYYQKWRMNHGSPSGANLFFLVFSAFLQHSLDGTAKKDPFRSVIEKIKGNLMDAPAAYGKTENADRLRESLQELRHAVDSVSCRFNK